MTSRAKTSIVTPPILVIKWLLKSASKGITTINVQKQSKVTVTVLWIWNWFVFLNRFYELLNYQNQMCKLRMLLFAREVTYGVHITPYHIIIILIALVKDTHIYTHAHTHTQTHTNTYVCCRKKPLMFKKQGMHLPCSWHVCYLKIIK